MSDHVDIWGEIGPALGDAVAEARFRQHPFFASIPDPPDERDETIAGLQALLRALLEKPWLDVGSEYWICRLCGSLNSPDHKPDCPVLRADELLGRP